MKVSVGRQGDSTLPAGGVIGIDGGGSRTRVALAGLDGRVVRAAAAGATSLTTVDTDIVVQRLAGAVSECVADLDPAVVRHAVAGFAGAGDGRLAARVTGQALARAGVRCSVEIRPDPELAFASGAAGQDGLVLVVGTGAVAARVAGWRSTRMVDGHGWLLGDDGSGFWIGAAGVRAALRALDGRGQPTALVTRLAGELDLEPDDEPDKEAPDARALRRGFVHAIMTGPPTALARLAPAVLAAAADGDQAAAGIAESAVAALSTTVGALEPQPGEPLVLAGGIANSSLGPRLATALTDRFGVQPSFVIDGLAGAIRLALHGMPVAGGGAI